MPERDEREDQQHRQDATCSLHRGARRLARGFLQRDVDVADDPAVEGAVPGTPEGEGGVVVGHAADHVLGRVDGVEEGPEAEETPWDEEFEPDDVEVEVGEHGELEGGVVGGPWAGVVGGGGCFGDGDGVGGV